MIRKTIISALMGITLSVGSVYANTVTTTVAGSAFVNLLPSFNQSITVQQVIINGVTNSAASAYLIDTPTNQLLYVNPAFTNTISYATNYYGIQVWTNYYGVVQSNYYAGSATPTSFALIDLTNNLVAATTNNYPVRLSITSAAGVTSRYDGVNYYFNQGIWATNLSINPEVISITYH